MSTIDAAHSVPLSIYGDECNAFRQSVMCFNWQAILNEQSKNSILIRFLIAIVPSDMYHIVLWPVSAEILRYLKFCSRGCGVFSLVVCICLFFASSRWAKLI